MREAKENARSAADLLGNLVAQTADSRRAERDVLPPVAGEALRPAHCPHLPMTE